MSVEQKSLSLQERVAARQQARNNFIKEITLIKEAKDGIANMLGTEPHISRRDRDGNHAPSTMWRYNLTSYWCYNNWADEFKDVVRINGENIDILDMLFSNANFLGQVKAQIRRDINDLGYSKVMFRDFNYIDRKTGKEVRDMKILVPV